ncbi:MAG: oxidoreductase, partial [Gammaproteobacteria bacterium]|nr:oxidoreductase [Gammaproteobacteria bacterium]
MDLYEAMGSQRAVRRLKADPISDAVLARVLTAASWAPTGGNV